MNFRNVLKICCVDLISVVIGRVELKVVCMELKVSRWNICFIISYIKL